MKYRHEFRIQQPGDKVWLFFEQPLEVAKCMPGVEEVEPLEGEGDGYSVRATQKARADVDDLPGQGPHHRAHRR